MKYYAVARGVQPGIYTDWPTAERMVKGFSGALYKSFATRAEAETFMANNNVGRTYGQGQTIQPTQAPQNYQPTTQQAQLVPQTYPQVPTQVPIQYVPQPYQPQPYQPRPHDQPHTLPLSDHTIIYTDGSMQNSLCGFGVVIITSEGDKLVAYGRVPENLGVTNNVAELYAIYVALSLVQGDVVLYSDSTYAIGVLTGWKANVNIALIQGIKLHIEGRSIKLTHVSAHVGIQYNEEVDKLADLGREQTEPLVVLKNGERINLS